MFDLSKLASIKIGLASPEVIKSWSYAEKQKPGYSALQRVTNVTVESTRRIPTLEQFVISVALK